MTNIRHLKFITLVSKLQEIIETFILFEFLYIYMFLIYIMWMTCMILFICKLCNSVCIYSPPKWNNGIFHVPVKGSEWMNLVPKTDEEIGPQVCKEMCPVSMGVLL